jgi:hypothetical protein
MIPSLSVMDRLLFLTATTWSTIDVDIVRFYVDIRYQASLVTSVAQHEILNLIPTHVLVSLHAL